MFKWIGVLAAIVLIISCYLTWVTIPVGNVDITGMNTMGTGFGKPGIMHIALAIIFMLFTLINKVWSRRANLLIIAFNTAWALRNLIIIPACHMGSCPERHFGLYLTLIASILMLVAALVGDAKMKKSPQV